MRTGVVTPEAVVLDLPTAGVATRTFARLVDLVIQVMVATALLFALLALGPFGISPTLVFLVVMVTALLVWPIGLEILWRGRSVGKAMFSLWVISADGSPAQPRQSVVRGLLALIDVYFSLGFVAILAAMFSPSGQRLGDMAASTVVVRHRKYHTSENPIVFFPPPGFEAYVASLDVGPMTPEEFSLVREFLLRVEHLDTGSRRSEALALAEALRVRIRHGLPASIDPELWLVCVASAFQWQEGGLLRDVARGVAPVATTYSPGVPAPVAAPQAWGR